MKTKKNIKRISLIILGLFAFIACFKFSFGADDVSFLGEVKNTVTGYMENGIKAAGIAGGAGITGISALLSVGFQEFALLIFIAIEGLTVVITGVSSGSGLGGSSATIGDVVFNRCGLTSANFFPEVWFSSNKADVSLNLIQNIGKYYYIIRGLSIAILLGILLYIGIRMAISTVASDEAKYKKMLVDWVISLILVFVLHYIMIITFAFNNSLVETLAKMDKTANTTVLESVAAKATVPLAGFDDLIVYGAMVVANFAFVLMYIKRVIVLGFLIVIAPLITITYAIDKIGDGKSQALNTWFKEFIFTVIIQPFHCVIYIVFYSTIMSTVNSGDQDLGKMIFAAAAAFFMLKAEGIVKKIFGIQPSGIGDALGTGAMALTMATNMFKGNKGKKIDESKGKMPDMNKANNGSSGGLGQGANGQGQGGQGQGGQGQGGQGQGGQDQGGQGQGGQGQGGQGQGGQGQGGQGPNGQEDPSKLSKIGNAIKKDFNRRGGWSGWAGRQIKGAATLAGVIAGGTVGDFKTAASMGTAARGIATSLHDSHQYNKAERQLINNQEEFAAAYQDFARAYRAEHEGEDISDFDIRQAAKEIYESGGVDLDSQYAKDLYDNMENLSDSAEIMGYKDGFDYVNDTMRLTEQGVVIPSSKHKPRFYEDEIQRIRNQRNNGGNNGGNP